MNWDKEIEFSGEFIRRLYGRDIISAFDSDLDKCCREIEKMMREQSVIIDNPGENYPNQSWCILNIEGIGLVKIPVAETPRYIKAITIACPVTDPLCVNSYRAVYKENDI